MPERVLASELSGLEIRTAILDIIGRRMQSDCFLSPNLAYGDYEADISIKIRARDNGRVAEVNIEKSLTHGDPTTPDPDHVHLEEADLEFKIDADAPNSVRVETGQEVPVLTKSKDGRPEIKGVKYARKRAEKA